MAEQSDGRIRQAAARHNFGGAHFEHGVPVAQLTTLRTGPVARRVITCVTEEQIAATLRGLKGGPPGSVLVLGGGSNVVVADDLADLTVVRLANSEIAIEPPLLRAQAGADWDGVVEASVAAGLGGLECLSGIPGSAGATPVQNVGAYGQEVAQTIARVRVWDRQAGAVRTLANADCAFTYRHSLFKGSERYVVLEVAFQLELADVSRPIGYAALAGGLGVELGTRVPLGDARDAVLAQRRQRGMVLDADDHDTWSCGSFFTNPIVPESLLADVTARARARLGDDVTIPQWPDADAHTKLSAAWLIDNAGFHKGHGLPGPVALSTKHTLAVTNRGGATAADVATFARGIRDGVRDAFGVTLVNEPVLVGHRL